MKRIIFALAVLLSAASCSPQAYTLYLQTRKPSDSGIDMDGKTMAVVYLENGSSRDSLFNNCVADGFASGLESEYFEGDNAVDICSIVTDADYSSKDSLQRLLLDMDVDVLFLIDRPAFADSLTPSGKVKVTSLLHAYDALGDDNVVTVNASTNVKPVLSMNSTTPLEAQHLGRAFTGKFINTWQDEAVTLIYYDNTKWMKALEYAESLDWDMAADIWMDLAQTASSPQMRSCACYNMAVACYLQKRPDLAQEWLAQSDKLGKISLSASLRKKML